LRRSFIGDVVSDKMQKTIVLKVSRKVQHSMFKRVMKRATKLKAHDENNECRVGDRVLVMETRPLSKEKNWKVVKILEKAKTLEE